MPAQQSRIDGFLSPSGSRTRKKVPKASSEAVASGPGIQLNFVDPRSYTVSTERRPADKSKSTEKMGRGKRKARGKKYGQDEERALNVRSTASSSSKPPAKRQREWDVVSEDSDDAKSVGSEEGTPERLGAVRLEAGKSQLQWGDRGRSSDSEEDESGSEEEEEERQKRRVVVSGEESDGHATPPPDKEPEVIDLESEPDVSKKATPPIRSSPKEESLADMFSDIPDPTQPSSSGYTRAARRPPPVAAASSTNKRRRRREPTPEEESSVYESEDPEGIIASPPPYRRAPPTISKSRKTASQGKKRKRGKRGVVDPDEEDGSEEEEDPEELVRELDMDSPGTFSFIV